MTVSHPILHPIELCMSCAEPQSFRPSGLLLKCTGLPETPVHWQAAVQTLVLELAVSSEGEKKNRDLAAAAPMY